MKALELKIPPPIVTLLFALVMWLISLTDTAIELNQTVRIILISALLLLAIIFVLAGVVNFGKASTTVNPLKPESASSLVTSGIYRITRNPMYVGLALLLLGWSVYLCSAISIIGVVGFILYLNRFQVVPEEQALLKIFGSEFERYQSKVRRWL